MGRPNSDPKRRVEISAPVSPLTDNPFTSLAGNSTAQSSQPDRPSQASGPPAFSVARTRKGGASIRVEKRRGRVVTIVDNVSGNATALLALLKRHCATGGVLREGAVELQGDQRDRVAELLRQVQNG